MSRGYAAIGVYHPKSESNIGSLWRSATVYGAAFVFTVGARYRKQASDTMHTARHIPLHHYTDMADLIEHLPHGCMLVGVEQHQRSRNLEGYGHLERAAYLLGAEDHGLPPQVVERCHSLVEVVTPTPLCLNVAVAGSIVLHDRWAKMVDRWAKMVDVTQLEAVSDDE